MVDRHRDHSRGTPRQRTHAQSTLAAATTDNPARLRIHQSGWGPSRFATSRAGNVRTITISAAILSDAAKSRPRGAVSCARKRTNSKDDTIPKWIVATAPRINFRVTSQRYNVGDDRRTVGRRSRPIGCPCRSTGYTAGRSYALRTFRAQDSSDWNATRRSSLSCQ